MEIFLGKWRVKTGSFFWRVFGRLLCRILGQFVVLLLLHWEVESVSWHNTTAVFTHFEKRGCSLVEACWATFGCHVSSFWTFWGSRNGSKIDLKLTQNWNQKCTPKRFENVHQNCLQNGPKIGQKVLQKLTQNWNPQDEGSVRLNQDLEGGFYTKCRFWCGVWV